MNKVFYIYFLTNWNNQILYIGVTNNLQRRLFEHRKGIVEGFTKKYNLKKLVYFEQTDDVYSAISREKQLKKWRREKKNDLVESLNPDWCDLAEDFSFYSK
jgi:putative endonuclease